MTSVARRTNHDSEDYPDASHHEIDQDVSGNDAGQPESDYDSAASDSEPSERDPDSQETERRVDDDEDRSNPQYIPKRGTFYEHDDRTAASGGEEPSDRTSETASEKKDGSETPSERRRGPRKSETVNKWSHDKYNENEQMPKSREELVAIYGYDIRNEDAPPHARRNRRYGRGPNKYTRTWEDEEAYKRQAAAPQPPRKPPNPEDFPELDASKRISKKRMPRPRSKSQPSSIESGEQIPPLRRNASIKASKVKTSPRQNVANRSLPIKTAPKREVREVREKLPPLENLTITATVVNNSQGQTQRKVNAAVAQQRPVPTEQGKKKPPPQAPPQNNAAPSKPTQQQTAQQQQQLPNQQQQTPAVAESRGGSKRYSSLRQRPLDTYAPQQNQQQPTQQQQQHRYHTEFPPGNVPTSQHQGSPVPQLHPQQLMQQMHRNAPVNQQQHGPSPPHQALPQQPLPQQPMPQQQLPQQPLPQQQLSQQQLSQQPLQQQQIPQQSLQQQQIPQQSLQQQQLPQQQLPAQHNQQVRLGILDQQLVPHPHHSIHNIPQPHTMVSGQLPPAQGYAPPAMMPAQYMQPVSQGGSGAVFGGAPMYAQPPAPYTHQMYPHPHNYAGGVTYYSCAEQPEQPPPPPRAQRRPTAAIPIVRPAAPDRPANSSEKDNIDRIVENMFVRKPWPATHGADSKEKSETRNSQEPQSKESSQPNSLTSSSISTDSKPSETKEDVQKEQETIQKEDSKKEKEDNAQAQESGESISTDA